MKTSFLTLRCCILGIIYSYIVLNQHFLWNREMQSLQNEIIQQGDQKFTPWIYLSTSTVENVK